MSDDLLSEIAAATGHAVIDLDELSGGCVSDVFLARLSNGESIVVKLDLQKRSGLLIEGQMLCYLSEHTQLPVPTVRYATDHLLLVDYIPGECRFTQKAEIHAAELLAALHTINSSSFGFYFDTLIGGLLQPNPSYSSWIDFFREQRLLFMASEATKAGRIPIVTSKRIERLGDHLDRWLLEPKGPSLIHGDVWTNNVLALGDRIRAFLDPAIYFGHAEVELAFITLFNTFGRTFFETYQHIRPIEPGFFEARKDIYNLYPLLVHVRLFGGSYLTAVERTLTRFGY